VLQFQSTVGLSLADPLGDVRSIGHRLLATGDHDIHLAEPDHASAVDDGIETGQTDIVDGLRRNAPWQSGLDGDLPGGVLARPCLDNLAENNLADVFDVNSCTLHGVPDRVGTEVDGTELGQGSEHFALW